MDDGSRKIKIIMITAGILLSIAVIITGSFQIRAAIRTGEFTGESLTRNLRVSIFHVGQDLFSDEWDLLSLLHRIRDPDGGFLPALEASLVEWYAGSENPELIEHVYIELRETEDFYRFTPGDSGLERMEGIPNGLFFLSFLQPDFEGEIFLDLKMDLLYGEYLPELMKDMESDYAWRIVDRQENTLASQSMNGIDFDPEMRIELSDKILFIFNDFRGFKEIDLGELKDDRRNPGPPEKDEHVWGSLEIYFVDGPLTTIVRRQIGFNLAAGAAALIFIILGYFMLFKLYRRSEIQRLQEQEFVATISHELRTPLAVLSTAGSNISRGIVKPERLGEYGKMITRESRRLEEMIESVLFYSGLQRGSRKVFLSEELDLHEVFAEIRERYLMKAAEMDVVLEFDIPEMLPRIKAGKEGLLLITGNLVYNGLIHAYPPGFRVTPEDRVVTVRVRLEKKFLVIEVEDRGCGIPAKEQKKVFTAFARGEMSRRSQIPGSGLGLHIAKRTAELSGGSLELDSVTESGSREDTEIRKSGTLFRFTLAVEIIKESHEKNIDY